MTLADQLRMLHATRKLHHLGPRPIFELFDEIVGRWPVDRREAFLQRLEQYAAIDPATLRALRGDTFPPAPVHEVER